MGRKNKKANSKIEEEFMPPELVAVHPHTPIYHLLTEKYTESQVEEWVDFYQKRPKEGVRELVTALVWMTGSQYVIKEDDVKESRYEEVREKIRMELEDITSETPISKYMRNDCAVIDEFWDTVCNALIQPKGMFLDEFETFKDWLFDFCESSIRPIRESATVSCLCILNFLADSIKKSSQELAKLEKSKEKGKVAERQKEVFKNELELSKTLSMQFFTTVVRHRFRDVDRQLRVFCIKCLASVAETAPEIFANDNFLKYIGTGLSDESPKIQKEALKQTKKLFSLVKSSKKTADKKVDRMKSFFKRIVPRLVELSQDSDNFLATTSLDLIRSIVDVIPDLDLELDDLFVLTGDSSSSVSDSAAKLFAQKILDSENESEEMGKQEVHEVHIRSLLDYIRSSKLDDDSICRSIRSFYPLMHCLKNWELLAQLLLSGESKKDTKILSLIFFTTAECCDENGTEKHRRNLSMSILRHFEKIIKEYSKKSDILLILIECLLFLQVEYIDESSTRRSFLSLLSYLKSLFVSSEDSSVFMAVFNVLHKWSDNDKISTKLRKQIRTEINSIASEFQGYAMKDQDSASKFQSVIEFVDMSQNQKVRDILFEATDHKDEEVSAIAINCLSTIFKWDVKRLMDLEKDERSDYLLEFNSLQTVFHTKIDSDSEPVQESAFKALSTLFALSIIIPEGSSVDDAAVTSFFNRFHTLKNKVDLFEYLIRPLQNGVIRPEYAVHALWYFVDQDLKAQVKKFSTSIQAKYPIYGYQLDSVVRLAKIKKTQIPQLMRFLTKKVDPVTALEAFLEVPDEQFLSIYVYFIDTLSKSDAKMLEIKSSGHIKQLIHKKAEGKKLSTSDLNIKRPSSAKKAQSSTESEEVSEDSES